MALFPCRSISYNIIELPILVSVVNRDSESLRGRTRHSRSRISKTRQATKDNDCSFSPVAAEIRNRQASRFCFLISSLEPCLARIPTQDRNRSVTWVFGTQHGSPSSASINQDWD